MYVVRVCVYLVVTVETIQGETKDVVINRMKSEQIADKRKIFELFTTILDIVAGYDERQVIYVYVCVSDRLLVSVSLV
jgi:hypothetical protein